MTFHGGRSIVIERNNLDKASMFPIEYRECRHGSIVVNEKIRTLVTSLFIFHILESNVFQGNECRDATGKDIVRDI